MMKSFIKMSNISPENMNKQLFFLEEYTKNLPERFRKFQICVDK